MNPTRTRRRFVGTPPSHVTVTADPARQAAYRRLALTILALDVPTLAARLQVSRLTPGGLAEQPQIAWAA